MVPPYGAIAERRIIHQLLRANAVTPSGASSIQLHRAIDHRRLRRLLDRGVMVEATAGHYFLDAPKFAEYAEAGRHRVVIAALTVIAVGLATILLAAWRVL
jgi:hypothetical protein